MKRLRPLVIFAVLIGGCFATEYVSHRRVNPTGRVFNLNKYLAWRPSADQFAAIRINGKPHVIAYGPAGGLLPSGPSAYVFDDTGRLVDWSPDIGDDPRFDQRWDAQKSRSPAHLIPRAHVQQLAATRPAG